MNKQVNLINQFRALKNKTQPYVFFTKHATQGPANRLQHYQQQQQLQLTRWTHNDLANTRRQSSLYGLVRSGAKQPSVGTKVSRVLTKILGIVSTPQTFVEAPPDDKLENSRSAAYTVLLQTVNRRVGLSMTTHRKPWQPSDRQSPGVDSSFRSTTLMLFGREYSAQHHRLIFSAQRRTKDGATFEINLNWQFYPRWCRYRQSVRYLLTF